MKKSFLISRETPVERGYRRGIFFNGIKQGVGPIKLFLHYYLHGLGKTIPFMVRPG